MNIEDRKTKKEPFGIPDNYFEDFHRDIMLHIQKNAAGMVLRRKSKIKTLTMSLTKWKYAAAVILLFVTGGSLFLSSISKNVETNIVSNEYSNEYIDELLDSYPIDDYTFYCYLTNNETDF